MTPETAAHEINLSSAERAEVLNILQTYLPGYDVWVFGSRVRGTAKDFSDLDLAVVSVDSLPLATLADLNEAFDESDLPFKVDVVDWASTSESFRKIIEAEKVVLQLATA